LYEFIRDYENIFRKIKQQKSVGTFIYLLIIKIILSFIENQ